jgi:DHA1 family inner membrane transport protein
MPWALIIAASIGFFAATASGSTRSPFLLDMATDLSVSLPAIANLFGVTSTAWGISSYIAGRLSDRYGRRVFMVFAPLGLAAASISIALSTSYGTLVAFIALGGLTCGAMTATSMAEVSLRTENHQRGRALGWVISGQSLTLLIGIPLAAWLGAYVGWRGVNVAIAVIALVAALLAFITTRPTAETRAAAAQATGEMVPLREALDGPIGRLFTALIMERVCFGLGAFYYPAFLRTSYDLPIEAVAIPLVGYAVGNIIGTVLGGQIADRFPYRRVAFAAMLIISGLIAYVWFTWTPSLNITIALGVTFALFNALGRPSLLAALADVPARARGVIMGLNSSVASIGWLIAALTGGWMYAGAGFGAFGPVMVAMCFLGALIVLPDTRLRAKL